MIHLSQLLIKKAKKQRQKVQKDRISATQPLTSTDGDASMSQAQMDTIISSIINTVGTDTVIDSSLPIHVCDSDFHNLRAHIDSLNVVIAQLNNKVEFLLSYLGLKDDSQFSKIQDQPGSVSVPGNFLFLSPVLLARQSGDHRLAQ